MNFYNTKKSIALAMNVEAERNKKGNFNIFTIGDETSGIYENFLYPNLRRKLGSYVIVDYNNKIYNETKDMLIKGNYDINVINLNNEYNPYTYIHSEEDVEVFVHSFFVSNNSLKKEDPFFMDVSQIIFSLIALYVFDKVPEKNKNLYYIQRIVKKLKENDLEYFKKIFFKVDENSNAYSKIKMLDKMKDKMYQNMLNILDSFFEKMPQEFLKATNNKSFDILSLDNKPSILFLEMTEFANINSLVCMQTQKTLFEYADEKKQHRLDMPVFFIYNKLEKIGYIDFLDNAIITANSRNIIYIIDINNTNFLMQLYKPYFTGIVQHCDFGIIFKTKNSDDINNISQLIQKDNLTNLYNDISRINNGCIVYQKDVKTTEEFQLDGKKDSLTEEELLKEIEALTQNHWKYDSEKDKIVRADNETKIEKEVVSTPKMSSCKEDILEKNITTEENYNVGGKEDILQSLKKDIDNETDNLKRAHLIKLYKAFNDK